MLAGNFTGIVMAQRGRWWLPLTRPAADLSPRGEVKITEAPHSS
jgi:hypothetical protein